MQNLQLGVSQFKGAVQSVHKFVSDNPLKPPSTPSGPPPTPPRGREAIRMVVNTFFILHWLRRAKGSSFYIVSPIICLTFRLNVGIVWVLG